MFKDLLNILLPTHFPLYICKFEKCVGAGFSLEKCIKAKYKTLTFNIRLELCSLKGSTNSAPKIQTNERAKQIVISQITE